MIVVNPDTPFKGELWEEIVSKRSVRLKLATSSLYYFAHIYFSEFIRYKTAPFQHEMYKLLADEEIAYAAIVAFRGSGKSTIATQIFPIWALLGQLNKKYILILSLNQNQAQNHLQNIKRQIEGNEMLLKDFGPMHEDSSEWGAMSLVFPKYNARISAASMGQSIRGTRHGAYRPDLIISDDIEDTETTKTKEGRDKIYNWYKSEVIPTGDIGTKVVLVGNLLHEDSLMMRVKEGIDNGESDGVFKMYPLLDQNDNCLWVGKYPDKKSIERERRKLNDRIAWHREYLLEILPTEQQVVYSEWLRYYDELPDRNSDHPDNELRYYHTYVGIDLAISEKSTADCTAMVAVHVFGFQESLKIYVDPHIVNKRMSYLKTLDAVIELVDKVGDKSRVELIVEEVGYQRSAIDQLTNKNYRVEGFKVHGSDKRSRFVAVSHLFEMGKVYFPRSTSKELTSQLTGFGVERHDDLVDAIVMTLQKIATTDKSVGSYGGRVVLGKTYDQLYEEYCDEFEGGYRPITAGLWGRKF